jgi:serine/threonine protein kinase
VTTADDELAIRAAGRVGTVLRGKYHLDRVLGIGGMAVVYAATHRNRKQFAVKVLNKELSFHADTRTRFLREGYVANSVEHPGSVAVLDDDVAEDGAAFLVMELLDGETVEELWERSRRRLPLDVVLKIAHQLLDVLAAAHLNGIVHRDVKPANVFLTRTGQLKVLDFGIARLRDVAVSHATNSGILLGTPAFMAPEQAAANASAIDARTDVWAVGAMMYTLASGRLVHDASNAIQVLMKAAQEPARSLGVLLPETPFKIIHLVDRALAFDKAGRWPSAAAMRDAIVDASRTLSPPTKVSSLGGSSLATLPSKESNPALAPTLASEGDVTRDEDDAALVSTEPEKKKSAARPAFDDVATSPLSSGNLDTRFVMVPTLASEPDVTDRDDAGAASTEPGKKHAGVHGIEFDTGDETRVLAPVPSSDAPTKIQLLGIDDAVVPGSDELATNVQPRPDARTSTMTALSQSRAMETLTAARPPTRFGRPLLPTHFYEASAAHFHVIARSTWKVWPTKLALLARTSLSSLLAHPTLLRGGALLLSVVAASITFIAVTQYRAHRGSDNASSVSEAATALQTSAPVAASETTDAVVAVDEVPTTVLTPPIATEPPSVTVAPTGPSPTRPTTRPSSIVRTFPQDDSTPELRKPAAGSAATARVKPAAPPTASAPPLSRPPSRCNPPYEFDSSGTKIWHRECL